jgi:hypothetical protein
VIARDGPGITWDHANPLTPPAYCYDACYDYIFVGAPKVPVGWNSEARGDLAPAGQVTAAWIVCDHLLAGRPRPDVAPGRLPSAWRGQWLAEDPRTPRRKRVIGNPARQVRELLSVS